MMPIDDEPRLLLTTRAVAALALLIVAVATVGCGETTTERLGLASPETVDELTLERYLGTWYEVASIPQRFQEGCEGTTATYASLEGGEIEVLNRCTVDGEPVEAVGLARPVDLVRGKLEVSFFGPFWGDYWVLELGERDGAGAPYSHAVVGSPSRDYLWVLSRTPSLPDATLDALLRRTADQGFELDRLSYTIQPDAE